jgi:hypothetical protein
VLLNEYLIPLLVLSLMWITYIDIWCVIKWILNPHTCSFTDILLTTGSLWIKIISTVNLHVNGTRSDYTCIWLDKNPQILVDFCPIKYTYNQTLVDFCSIKYMYNQTLVDFCPIKYMYYQILVEGLIEQVFDWKKKSIKVWFYMHIWNKGSKYISFTDV